MPPSPGAHSYSSPLADNGRLHGTFSDMFGREDPRPSDDAAVARPASGDAEQRSGAVFLGGLASAGSSPRSDLPPRFAALAGAVGDLFDDYRAGEITAVEFADALATRRITDARGVEWTIGATSGGWFRREGAGAWRSSLPPTEADDTESDPLERLLATVDRADDPTLAPPEPVPALPDTMAAVPELPAEPDGGAPLLDAWGEPAPAAFEVADDTPSAWDDVAVTAEPQPLPDVVGPAGEEVVDDAELTATLVPEPLDAGAHGEVSSPWVEQADDTPGPLDPIAALELSGVLPVDDEPPTIAPDEAASPASETETPLATPAPPAPAPGGWDDVELAAPVEPPAPVRRGEGAPVWGAADTFDPAAAAPEGIAADGISGESRWLNGAAEAAGESPDPLAELLGTATDTGDDQRR